MLCLPSVGRYHAVATGLQSPIEPRTRPGSSAPFRAVPFVALTLDVCSPFVWRSLTTGRHPHPRQGRWPHRADLRDPSGYCQVDRRLLPEVYVNCLDPCRRFGFVPVLTVAFVHPCRRRRGLEEGDQGHPPRLRPYPPGRRPPPLRVEEVRRWQRPRSLPEVVPLNCFGRELRLLLSLVYSVAGPRFLLPHPLCGSLRASLDGCSLSASLSALGCGFRLML
jgi:hypothetical protein